MSLYARIAEEKLRALYGEDQVRLYGEDYSNRKLVFENVRVIDFYADEFRAVIEDENVGTVKLNGIKKIEPQHYLRGVLISASSERYKPRSPKVRTWLRLEFDYPDYYAYVVVKGDTIYLYDGVFCKEYPEECNPE